jgi:type IV pilus assembly protein PilV
MPRLWAYALPRTRPAVPSIWPMRYFYLQQIPRRNPRSRGFSLLEVLIAVVVLSFGLLGVVGLHASALQNNRAARLQSTAVQLGRELGEMMRGNKAVALQAADNPYLGEFNSPLAAATAATCLSVGSVCATNVEVASAELSEWLSRVDGELPGARVTICRDDAPYDAGGRPRWACADASASDTLVIKIGWTTLSTDGSQSTSDRLLHANADTARPMVVLPVTSGV